MIFSISLLKMNYSIDVEKGAPSCTVQMEAGESTASQQLPQPPPPQATTRAGDGNFVWKRGFQIQR
jgi:hypothetical protein